MKAIEAIPKITQFMNTEKEVFVYLYTRDSDNCVIKTEVYPLEAVFAHEHGMVKLCIEASQSNIIND